MNSGSLRLGPGTRFLCFLVLAVAAGAQFASADDLADLRAADQAMVKAHNDLDGVALAALRHPQSVSFISEQPDAIDRSRSTAQELVDRQARSFAGLERITITPRAMQYRLVGDIGIAWGFQRYESKPKGGTLTVREERVLRVWSKTDGRWLLVTSHFSTLPTTP
jgi:ketosteroid isomerase-like protein